MKRIVAALYPRSLASSIALPMDILRAASQAARSHGLLESELEFLIAAEGKDPVATVGGLSIAPDIGLQAIAPCDLLLLPAMWRNPRPIVQQNPGLLKLLPDLAASGTIICSVGTGSCFLAEAGLLDARAATTHWNYFDEFSKLYPKVQLKRAHLITQSDNLFCAGSVNSIADLLLHIVEDWYGPGISRHVENQFSPEIRRPFRAHAYQSVEDSGHQDELVIEAQQWLLENLAQAITIAELAERLQCSSRTLNRRFRRATGQTPSHYLRSQRLNAATELLRATNLSVGEVAWQVGLHDVSYFTSIFRQHTGLTPAKYQRSVRGKLFQPSAA
jgi:transcriptional regulator GlxA family with amidase domain